MTFVWVGNNKSISAPDRSLYYFSLNEFNYLATERRASTKTSLSTQLQLVQKRNSIAEFDYKRVEASRGSKLLHSTIRRRNQINESTTCHWRNTLHQVTTYKLFRKTTDQEFIPLSATAKEEQACVPLVDSYHDGIVPATEWEAPVQFFIRSKSQEPLTKDDIKRFSNG